MKAKIRAVKPNLAREIAARTLFLKKVTDFAEAISGERGKELHYSQGSSHTHTIYELHDFGGFSFHADTGRTMFGGNQVKVWYHPAAEYTPGLPPVLDIEWQVDIEKCTHLQFNADPQWQRAILKVIQRRKGIAAKLDKAVAKKKRDALRAATEGVEQAKLAETARRLQIQ